MVEPVPEFERYDEDVARGLVQAHERAGGLPGWLGIRLVDAWPGGLRSELEVREELLTPFRNLHGGVLAALVDHMLGTVCYPVMPPGSWAATTEFKLNYLAPVTEGVLSAVSQVISLTKRTAVVRITVSNRAGPAGGPDDNTGPGGRPDDTAGPGGRPDHTAGPGGPPGDNDRLVCSAQGTVLVMAPRSPS